MAIIKKIGPFIVITFFLYLLNGCASTQPETGAGMPLPTVTRAEGSQQSQTVTAARPKQIEQPASPEPVTPSKLSSSGIEEPARNETIPVDDKDMKFVQQRLQEYQVKLDQWLQVSAINEESRLAAELSPMGVECVQLLERILTGYGSLFAIMKQNEALPAEKRGAVDTREMQQFDIAFLESRCDTILALDTAGRGESATDELQYTFKEAQQIIISQVQNENFHEALLGYSRLSVDYPDREPSIVTQMNYVLALQYTGQVEAASRYINKMLDSENLAVEPISLQLQTADFLLASGNISAAQKYYENLIQAHKAIEAEKQWALEQLDFLRTVDHDSEDMVAFTKLMREFLTYDYRLHSVELNEKINSFASEYAGNPIAVRALKLKSFAVEQLNFWFGRQLVKIDSLVAEKKFNEAAEFLKSMAQYNLPANLQAVIQRTYYDIAQAELQETENRKRVQEMELNDQWDAAVHLMDSQRFDMAIVAFKALKGTKLEKQAGLKIVEAANRAAGQLRKEAAALFIQAGKTPDLEKKKELLLESYNLLNEILAKFPQTDLLDKVQQNIAILEEQIRKIDPSLLEASPEQNS